MNEVITPPIPVAERKCRLEELFDAGFIELLRLVPRNPLVRALVMKLTGKMPAPECDTFEQLRDWVETNCDKKASAATAPGRRTRDDGIAITVEFADTEYGRADYSVRRHGSGEFRIGAADLMEIIQEAIGAGGGLDEAVEVIAGKVDNDAWEECDPEMDCGDYNYDEHDSNDTGDSGTEFSKRDIRNAVLAFVRERHPELAAEL